MINSYVQFKKDESVLLMIDGFKEVHSNVKPQFKLVERGTLLPFFFISIQRTVYWYVFE